MLAALGDLTIIATYGLFSLLQRVYSVGYKDVKIYNRTRMRPITIFIALSLLFYGQLAAQIAVNNSGSLPDPSAGLDVNFTNKGFLPPRLTAAQILAIPDPAEGLIVFNTTEGKPAYFDGTAWCNFDGKEAWLACGDALKKVHMAGNVAPVNKTVIYGTVTGIPGETTKCWITSNLGADRQATAVNDSSETSAGWYWQFNRKQGYKHSGGTNITPEWSTADISENLSWTSAEDPCAIELGTGWRIPVSSEWSNVDAAGSWTTWSGPWASGLKLHAAGCISASDGQLTGRTGSARYGYYWSGSSYGDQAGYALKFDISISNTNDYDKNYGYSIRCLKE